MSVLVDTSIWVRAIAGMAPFAAGLTGLLQNEEAIGHELIYGEILMGDTGGGRRKILVDYVQMPFAARVPHEEVAGLVTGRRLHGRGIGWIDAHLLASAMAARMKFWTADERLAAIADELGIGYRLHHA